MATYLRQTYGYMNSLLNYVLSLGFYLLTNMVGRLGEESLQLVNTREP